MALAIATNNAALQAAASASSVNRDMDTSMARLSTGKRINAARDDAAGVAIASRLAAEIRGTDQAIRNALDGQALIDSAEGGHKEIENILQRMREVSVQAANDTNSADDRSNLQAEFDALVTEIDRISSVTTWAGQSMMSSTGSDFSFQVGTATDNKNQIRVNLNSMTAESLGIHSHYPGKNNTDDVAFFIDRVTVGGDIDCHITFSGNTTSGAVSLIEIKGKEYIIAAGTVSERSADLQSQLLADGVAGGIASSGDLYYYDEGALFSDYTEHFGREAFGGTYNDGGHEYDKGYYLIGDPLNGNNDDGNNPSGRPELNGRYGVDAALSLTSSPKAMIAVDRIDTAIKAVNTQRSSLGAISNRLSHTVNNLTNISANLSTAKGVIEDADFAHETSNLAKKQILQQASTAMLAQANASKQNVLSLLQG